MAMSRSLGSRCVTSRSPMWMLPDVGSSRPARQRSSVLFPQPEGPTSTQNPPEGTSRSMPLRMCVSPKDFFSPVTSTEAIRRE
jgi:hypothetical protein